MSHRYGNYNYLWGMILKEQRLENNPEMVQAVRRTLF
jgi:hypothetical protein